MTKVFRIVLVVLLGFTVWYAVATIGNVVLRGLFPGYAEVERAMTFAPAMMAARLVLGIVSSIVAGLACGLALRSAPGAVSYFAAALIVFFLPVHYALWDRFPAWYHAVFLLSLAPSVLLGAWLARRGTASAASAGPADRSSPVQKWSAGNWQYQLGIGWAIVSGLAIVVFLGLDVLQPVPDLRALQRFDATVTEPPEIIRASRGPWSLRLQTDRGPIQVQDICLVWECDCECDRAVPVTRLAAGERLTLWADEGHAWQIARGGAPILRYEDAVEGHWRLAARRYGLFVGLLVIGALLAAWGRRRMNAGP